VASPIPGHEYFQNAGNTLRQGIEANASYKWDRWNAYANFTYVDATFQNALILSSPFNPYADANGNIYVVPGDHLTGMPDFRFKLGAEYQITNPWKLGADLNVIGSQWLVGDASNQMPKVPAYWVVNLHSSYKVSENIEVFGLVRNLFDQHYYVYGTLFETDSFPYLNLTDPRTFIPGIPFAAYVGVRGTMPTAGRAVAAAPQVMPTKGPAIAAPVVNWTGIYLGVNAGYSFGASDWSDSVTGGSTGSFGTYGFLFGGTLGANYQVGALVFGIEADGDRTDPSGFGTFTAAAFCTGSCQTTSNWLATVRGRVGYAFDRFLVYGTAGAAFGDVIAGYSEHSTSNATEPGWTVGAGVEGAFAPHWTAKVEYLFVDLANGTCTTDCAITNPNGAPLIPNIAVKFNESMVRAGVNYKFSL
jgi:opacity protein-like surface antigen